MASTKSAPAVKASPSAASTPKSKKSSVSSKTLPVVLRLSPETLKAFPHVVAVKEVKAVKVHPVSKATKAPSSDSSNTIPKDASSPGENNSESNSNTPAPSATDDSVSMPPPTEGIKKTKNGGVKRTSSAANDLLKPRGKPGPKKKAKLDDGEPDSVSGTNKPAPINAAGAHKLGPKANQGAINAGLRALDRTGKPCRKWAKGGFSIKTFTGTVWEIPRWKAPPKVTINGDVQDSSASGASAENGSGGSNKENKLGGTKENSSRVDSEKSVKSSGDVEMSSAPPSVPASSPAPTTAPAVVAA